MLQPARRGKIESDPDAIAGDFGQRFFFGPTIFRRIRMATKLELQTKRNTLVAQGRAIFDLAKKEKREMTAQESTDFDKYMDESDKVRNEIDGSGGKGGDR